MASKPKIRLFQSRFTREWIVALPCRTTSLHEQHYFGTFADAALYLKALLAVPPRPGAFHAWAVEIRAKLAEWRAESAGKKACT